MSMMSRRFAPRGPAARRGGAPRASWMEPASRELSTAELESALIAARTEQHQAEVEHARAINVIKKLRDKNERLSTQKAEKSENTESSRGQATIDNIAGVDEVADLRRTINTLRHALADAETHTKPRTSPQTVDQLALSMFPERKTRDFVVVYRYRPMHPIVLQIDGVYLRSMPLREGDIVAVEGEQRAEGYYVGVCNGLRGLAPAAYLEPLDLITPNCRPEVMNVLRTPMSSPFAHGMALTTREAQFTPPSQLRNVQVEPSAKILPFKKGDKFESIEPGLRPDGFEHVKTSSGKSGLVPHSFMNLVGPGVG